MAGTGDRQGSDPARVEGHAQSVQARGAGARLGSFLLLAIVSALGGLALGGLPALALPDAPAAGAASGASAATVVTVSVCPAPTPHHFSCMLEVHGRSAAISGDVARQDGLRPVSVAPLATLGSTVLSPRDIATAYGFAKSDPSTGTGTTVAVVDAYEDPTATADLATFSSQFGLPSCTVSSGCLVQHVMAGTGAVSTATSGWTMETSLDIEWVHAMAPKAHVLLVEADTTTMSTMLSAATYAASNAPYVSMSWGGPETATDPSVGVFSSHAATVSFFASAGDTASEVVYPSASPDVIAVGGTKLTVTLSSGAFKAESAWKTGGGGCSQYEPAAAAQASFPTYDQSGATCAGKRATPDVAADATPATGVAVYASQPTGTTGWWQVGGTSLSAPLWAGHAAAAGLHVTATLVYGHTLPFHDVTSGSNGHACVTGYNLCDGLGSWNAAVGATYDAPLQPARPTAVPGVAQASVSWQAPTPGDAPITSYTVTSTPSGHECAWSSGPLTCTVTGLTNGTSYGFTVTATNSLGTSPPSSPSAPVIANTALPAPTGVVATARSTSVRLRWTAVATASGYDVVAGATSGGGAVATPVAGCTGVTTAACNVTGLGAGTTYYFSVKTLHTGVLSTSASSALTVATVPAPAGLHATTGTGSVSLGWSAVSGAASYDVFVATAAGAETYVAPSKACPVPGAGGCTVSGLVNGKTYYFTVEATGSETNGTAFTTTPSGEASILVGPQVSGSTSGGGGSGGGGSGGGGSGGASAPTPTAPAAPAGTSSDHGCAVSSGTCRTSNDGVTLTTSSGSGALTVSQYFSNPGGAPSFSSTDEYFDVELAAGSSFGTATVKDCNLNGGTALYWWDPAANAWESVSPVVASQGTARCLVATLGPGTSPAIDQLTGTAFAVGTSSVEVPRISGYTADATAADELAHQFSPKAGDCPSSGAVVLSRDNYYSDALASQYLAASLGTGTLLTPTSRLSTVTKAAIEDEGISHVYVVGGSLAVSTAVVAAIDVLPVDACGGTTPVGGTVEVTRIAGYTEYATAEAIATAVPSSFVGHAAVGAAYAGTNTTGGPGIFNATPGAASTRPPSGAPTTAILATGVSFQDAESASVMSYDAHLPVLLSAPNALSPAALTAIETLGVTQVVVMGGPLAISDAVVSSLQDLGVAVLRVAGVDAADTALEAADFELSASGLHWAPVSQVVVARGDFYSDGLAGAIVAAGAGRSNTHAPEPLLLTKNPSSVGQYLTPFLQTAGTGAGIATDGQPVTGLTILGGSLALTTTTVRTLERDIMR